MPGKCPEERKNRLNTGYILPLNVTSSGYFKKEK
jgi:hypothetical protein